VIAGQDPGLKVKKAKDLAIPVLNEVEWHNILANASM